MRLAHCLGVFLVTLSVALAQQGTVPAQSVVFKEKGLQIALPENADVQFEVDARDDDLLAVLRKVIAQFDSATNVNLGAASIADQLTASDISSLFKNIHELHIISYTATGDAQEFFEPKWSAEGLHRMLFVGGDSPILVMRGSAGQGMAMLFSDSDGATVIKTDGMLNMPVLGRLLGQLGKAYLTSLGQAGKTSPAAPKASATPHKTNKHSAKKSKKK